MLLKFVLKYFIKENFPLFQFYIKCPNQGLQVPSPTPNLEDTLYIKKKRGGEHWVTVNTKPSSAKRTKLKNPKDT